MANFKTHVGVGVVASGMLATLTMAAAIVPANDLVTLALVGALGSVLPDVDLENSRASQAMFNGLALFISFALLFNYAWPYSIAEMWVLWVGTFVLIRYGAYNVFHKFAAHRGIFHSILAAAFFALMTVVIYSRLFNADDTLSWLAGAFMFIGYIIHLLLDEIYSVDFYGNTVKRSFGTALKLFDSRHVGSSLAMVVAVVGVFFLAPTADPFVAIVGDQEVWSFLQERMLPQDGWFGFERLPQPVAVTSGPGAGLPVSSN